MTESEETRRQRRVELGRPTTKPANVKRPKQGGLKHLQRLLGLREDYVLQTDAVFVSLDLEVNFDREKLDILVEKPIVRELAIASLDTRDIRSLSPLTNLRNLIKVQMFEVKLLRTDKKSAEAKARERAGRQCVFGPTQSIPQEKVYQTIIQNLQIADDLNSSKPKTLRNIALVGHSIGEDLRVLRYFGIDIVGIAPILTIIDTHLLSRFILPPYHPTLPSGPEHDFSLAGVLAELGLHPPRSEFHNAGNDSVYSIYAMLLLGIRNGMDAMADLKMAELRNLDKIRDAVFKALGLSLSHVASRAQQANPGPEITLGFGLEGLVWMA